MLGSSVTRLAVSNFGRQLSQFPMFSSFFFFFAVEVSMADGVPTNQGNYLSVLEFISEGERQLIRGCKNYLRKKYCVGKKCLDRSQGVC
jgi:hypothetical protein